jgi:hypothetical protein
LIDANAQGQREEDLAAADALVEPQTPPAGGLPADAAVGASDDRRSESPPVLTLDPDYARALVVYDNFLRGGYGKWDENDEYTPAVAEGLTLDWDGTGYVPFGDHPWTYALYDMNHDGIPEISTTTACMKRCIPGASMTRRAPCGMNGCSQG